MDLINHLKSDKRIFAKGLCFDKLFIIFLIASIFGAYYEQILHLIYVYRYEGIIEWTYRRGVIYGPFNVIYGFGAAIIIYFLAEKNHKWYQTFLYGALLGGGIEYIIGFLQETFTHTISWDYSNNFLNINGRTTIPFMLVWGLLTVLFVKVVYPFLAKHIEKIPYVIGKVFIIIMLIFMIFNMFISWSAIIRQTLRKNNIAPITSYGEFLDKHYPDEYLKKYFPNMVSR